MTTVDPNFADSAAKEARRARRFTRINAADRWFQVLGLAWPESLQRVWLNRHLLQIDEHDGSMRFAHALVREAMIARSRGLEHWRDHNLAVAVHLRERAAEGVTVPAIRLARHPGLAAVAAAALVAHGAAAGAQEASVTAADLTASDRISQPPPAFSPPPLPAGADAVPPLTLSVTVVRRDGGRESRSVRTVLRTAERVLVVGSPDSEWLFEQNPADPRRVTGYRVDHARRRVLVHDESELRHSLGLRGWADVLTLRLPPEARAGLRATGEHEVAAGARFERLVATPPPERGLVEVWWSEPLLLPLRVADREGAAATTTTVEVLEAGVDTARLALPTSRLPDYELGDASDVSDHRH